MNRKPPNATRSRHAGQPGPPSAATTRSDVHPGCPTSPAPSIRTTDGPRAAPSGDSPPSWHVFVEWVAWVRASGDVTCFVERACDRLYEALFELDQLIGALYDAPVCHEYRLTLASELSDVGCERLEEFAADLVEGAGDGSPRDRTGSTAPPVAAGTGRREGVIRRDQPVGF